MIKLGAGFTQPSSAIAPAALTLPLGHAVHSKEPNSLEKNAFEWTRNVDKKLVLCENAYKWDKLNG